MRKLVIISTIAALLSISSALYVYFDKEPSKEYKKSSIHNTPEESLIGKTFLVQYYPLKNDDASSELSLRLNKNYYKITFQTDSTYWQESTKYIREYKWSRWGSYIILNNRSYTYLPIGESLLLQDSMFEVSLTPLR